MERIINSRLGKYTICELRVLGQWLNLKNPTALSKEDLIVEIEKVLKVENRQIEEDDGVEANEDVYHFETLDLRENSFQRLAELEQKAIEKQQMEENLYEYSSVDTTKYSSVRLSAKIDEYVIIKDGDKSKKIKNKGLFEHNIGCIDYVGDFLVLRNFDSQESIIELSQDQIKQYKFKQYDTVDYLSFYSPYQFRSYLVQVNSINGVEIKDLNREEEIDFTKLVSMSPKKVINFQKDGEFLNLVSAVAPICRGARMLVYGGKDELNHKIMNEVASVMKAQGENTISVYVDLMKEQEEFFRTDVDVVTLKIGDTLESKLYGLLSAFMRAERYVEAGKDVTLLIDDLDGVYKILEGIISDKNPNYITSIVTRLFDHGGSYNNGGSMTLIGFDSGENLRLSDRIKKCATLVIPIDKNFESQGMYPAVDIKGIENKLQKFYMDEDSITVVKDLLKALEEMDEEGYKKSVSVLKRIKINSKEELIKALYSI